MNNIQSQLEKWQTHQNNFKKKPSRPDYWDDKPIDFEVFSKLELEHRNYYTRKKAMKTFLEGVAYAKQLKKFLKERNL